MIALLLPCFAADWVETIDRDTQLQVLSELTGQVEVAGQRIASRHIEHPDHSLAVDLLWARLRRIPGLVTRIESFSAAGRTDLSNLIAVLPGSDPSLAPLVVSAHLDSTSSLEPGSDPATDPAPGADDDASGCAAILELARVLRDEPGFERDIEFILFDAEEQGLLGSAYHVANRTRDVQLMVSLDPVGFNAGGWLFASSGPGTEAAVEAFKTQFEQLPLSAVQRFDAVDAALIGAPRSDHGPFIEAGYPAIHLATFPQPPSYHTASDTLDVVDPDFLAETTALVAATFATLAQPVQPTPASTCSTGPAPRGWFTLFGARRRTPLRPHLNSRRSP